MTITVGDSLPEASLAKLGDKGPEQVAMSDVVKGRRVVIFAVPGAFTPTCQSAHVPSFIKVKDDLVAKGVDEVICISVNDPWVMEAFGRETGADKAGITMLADGSGAFTKAIGMDFDAPPVGFIGRSQRYAMMAEDGVVKVLHIEEGRGTCEISGGEAMLAVL